MNRTTESPTDLILAIRNFLQKDPDIVAICNVASNIRAIHDPVLMPPEISPPWIGIQYGKAERLWEKGRPRGLIWHHIYVWCYHEASVNSEAPTVGSAIFPSALDLVTKVELRLDSIMNRRTLLGEELLYRVADARSMGISGPTGFTPKNIAVGVNMDTVRTRSRLWLKYLRDEGLVAVAS